MIIMPWVAEKSLFSALLVPVGILGANVLLNIVFAFLDYKAAPVLGIQNQSTNKHLTFLQKFENVRAVNAFCSFFIKIIIIKYYYT